MEILQSYTKGREGNDCLIKESIALISVAHELFIVIHITQIRGGWTDNPIEAECQLFYSLEDARTYFNEQLYNLQYYERIILRGEKICT